MSVRAQARTRILTVFGTRPEAIKLAPVVRAFEAAPEAEHAVCVTAQHRQMLDQVLETFDVRPAFDLDIMKQGQSLADVTAAALAGTQAVVREFRPDWVIVQGDTTSAFAAALAAFYEKVPVAHVEAGLRTGNIYSPWPEEMNRRLVGCLATVHLPPTDLSRQNLLREGVADASILVTGNTVIDALQWISGQYDRDTALRTRYERQFSYLNPDARLVLVTGHRRENFDGGLERVCRALRRLAGRGDVEIVYPVHLNPNVQSTAQAVLGDAPNVRLIEPLDYLAFVWLMRRASLIVTDSGGIQEEAPSLGKPVLVTRDTTERPEAVAAGTARLVGTDEDRLFDAATQLLDDSTLYDAMARAKNPFGDGRASERIVSRLLKAPS